MNNHKNNFNSQTTGALAVGLLFLTAVVLLFTANFHTPNSGQHTGYVSSVEQSGIIWKTWTAYIKTDPQSSQEDAYCVTDPDTVAALQSAATQRNSVTVYYSMPLITWKWQCGGEQSIIQSIDGSVGTSLGGAGSNATTNNQTFTADNSDQQAQCATQGEAFFQKFRASADTGVETTWQPPEYHFNTRLQTCLMAWQDGGLVAGTDIESGAVIDILENKEILGDVDIHGGWDQYIQQKDILMSE